MLELNKTVENGELQIFVPLAKVDIAKREVWGVVTAEEPDKSGEICDYDSTAPYYKEVVAEMSKATDGANIFPLRAMHGLIAAGKGIGIEFRKAAKEIYMGFKVVDDGEWKKVVENVYTGFSQGGRYIKRWQDGDFTRYTAKPGEVSLVDLPCCTRAHFEVVKADGSTEMRKFSKTDPGGQAAGSLSPTVGIMNDVKCTCTCTNCVNGNCSGCTAGTNCGCAPTKAAKALLNFKSNFHLGYTKADGSFDTVKMQRDWIALQKYEGPDKEKAIKRLKHLYACAGKYNPIEKSAALDDFLKSELVDAIQRRAYGRLNKGMYTVANFARILEDIRYLWLALEMERDGEGDESPATDSVREIVGNLLSALLAYTEEQVSEAKQAMASR